MKPQIKTIKSNDFVPYFNFTYDNGVSTTPNCNCTPRSVRASQIANLDLDFGMLFIYTGETYDSVLTNHGYGCVYAYHTWNTDENSIYDSNFQLEQLGVDECDRLVMDDYVMVVDMEHLQALMEKKGTPSQIQKAHKKVVDEIKKVQFQAKLAGVKHLYISGFSYSIKSNMYMNTKEWNEDVDMVEKRFQEMFV